MRTHCAQVWRCTDTARVYVCTAVDGDIYIDRCDQSTQRGGDDDSVRNGMCNEAEGARMRAVAVDLVSTITIACAHVFATSISTGLVSTPIARRSGDSVECRRRAGMHDAHMGVAGTGAHAIARHVYCTVTNCL